MRRCALLPHLEHELKTTWENAVTSSFADQDALAVWGEVNKFYAEHQRMPSLESEDTQERELAQAMEQLKQTLQDARSRVC